MRKIFEHVFERLDTWFETGEEFFPFESGTKPGTLPFYAEKLAYHNFQIWNYENYGRSDRDDLVVFGWRGAQENNKERNLAINGVDGLMRPRYRPEAEIHSETLGSIFDRITIQYLKLLHHRERDPDLAGYIGGHLQELLGCAERLHAGILAGRLRCLELPRLKLYFFEENGREEPEEDPR